MIKYTIFKGDTQIGGTFESHAEALASAERLGIAFLGMTGEGYSIKLVEEEAPK